MSTLPNITRPGEEPDEPTEVIAPEAAGEPGDQGGAISAVGGVVGVVAEGAVGGAVVASAPGTSGAVTRFVPRAPQPTLNPRKVRGGVKISSKVGPVSPSWAAQRWLRLPEEMAPNDALAEGIAYARAGQTKSLALPQAPAPGAPTAPVNAGHISAKVQGRLPTPYSVDIRLPVFNFEQWEKVIETMVSEAKHVAGLLAGEVPPAIEDVFRPSGLRLFPQDLSEITFECNCVRMNALALAAQQVIPGAVARPPRPEPAVQVGPFCKHVCCVMAIVAERLGQDPFLIFALRGLWKEDLLERLRQKRAIAQSKAMTAPGGADRHIATLTPRIPGVTDCVQPPLSACLDSFWSAPASAEELDLSITPAPVTHPLLRRLGPSPFTTAKFPLVGLLATCYDVISESVTPPPTREG